MSGDILRKVAMSTRVTLRYAILLLGGTTVTLLILGSGGLLGRSFRPSFGKLKVPNPLSVNWRPNEGEKSRIVTGLGRVAMDAAQQMASQQSAELVRMKDLEILQGRKIWALVKERDDLKMAMERQKEEMMKKMEELREKDNILCVLQSYHKLYNENQSLTFNVSLPYLEQIDTWWKAAAMIQWYMSSKPRYECKKVITVDTEIICQDDTYSLVSPCIIYTFGVVAQNQNGSNFESEASKFLGCEVYSFNPRFQLNDNLFDPKTKVMYLPHGLGEKDDVLHVTLNDEQSTSEMWKVHTLESIRATLGHSKRIIDILRLDIGPSLWSPLGQIVQNGLIKVVRQLVVKFVIYPGQPPNTEMVNIFKVYTTLRDMGFLEFQSSLNHRELFPDNMIYLEGEVHFINQHIQDIHL